jgi:hypothetical protein
VASAPALISHIEKSMTKSDSPWKSEEVKDSDAVIHTFNAFPAKHSKTDPAESEYCLVQIEMSCNGKTIGSAHIELTPEQLDEAIIDLLHIRLWLRYGRSGQPDRRAQIKSLWSERKHTLHQTKQKS